MSSASTMLDTTKYSKAFNTQLIELFRSKPCLWRNDERANLNRHERESAWEALVDKLREVDPSADRAFAIRKMNAFRSSWRREHKKVKRWRAVGEKYYPKLWYYDLFNFIEEDESGSPWEWDQSQDGGSQPAGSSNHAVGGLNLLAGSSNQTMDDSTEPMANVKSEMIIESTYDMDENGDEEADPFAQEETTRDASTPRSSSSAGRAPPPPSANSDRRSSRPDHSLVPIAEPPAQLSRLDLVGKNWAEKLKLLPDDQRVFAEKLINDVLFEAELGALGRHCFVSTQLPR